MDEIQESSLTEDLKQQSIETAKGLAPWRAGLPWWVVLVEGSVLGVVGILILIDPRKATVNMALFLAAALVIAGILQLWAILRGRIPESIDSLLAARGAIGIYAGGMVLLLFFLEYLSTEAGLIAFGLGSLIYGLLGLWASIASSSRRRASSIVEGVFFTLFGLLLIYVLYAGSEQVEQVTKIVGWAAIVGGLALIGLSFYNRSRDADRESAQEQVAVAGATAKTAANLAQDASDAATEAAVDALKKPNAPDGP